MTQTVRTVLGCLLLIGVVGKSARADDVVVVFLYVQLEGASVVSPWPSSMVPQIEHEIGERIADALRNSVHHRRLPWRFQATPSTEPLSPPHLVVTVKEKRPGGVPDNWLMHAVARDRHGEVICDFNSGDLLPAGELQLGLAPGKNERPARIAEWFISHFVSREDETSLKAVFWKAVPLAEGIVDPGPPLAEGQSLVLLPYNEYRYLGRNRFRWECKRAGVPDGRVEFVTKGLDYEQTVPTPVGSKAGIVVKHLQSANPHASREGTVFLMVDDLLSRSASPDAAGSLNIAD